MAKRRCDDDNDGGINATALQLLSRSHLKIASGFFWSWRCSLIHIMCSEPFQLRSPRERMAASTASIVFELMNARAHCCEHFETKLKTTFGSSSNGNLMRILWRDTEQTPEAENTGAFWHRKPWTTWGRNDKKKKRKIHWRATEQ